MTLGDVVKELDKRVTLDRFSPVEKIAYGFIGIVLTTVLVFVLSLILRK